MTILQFFQIISLIGYSIYVFILALCPYKGEEFKTYHRVRYLMMGAMGAMALQFLFQIVFEFRTRDVLMGMTCNMVFIMIASQLGIMVIFHLLRNERSCRKEWFWSIIVCIANGLLLLAGSLTGDSEYQRASIHASFGFYDLANIVFLVLAIKEFRTIKLSLQQYYEIPVEENMAWIYIFIIMRLIICICIPLMLTSNDMAMLFSIIIYIVFGYYIAKFMYYGMYIHSVEVIDEAVIVDDSMTSEAPVISSTLFTEIEDSINKWIAKEKFRETGLTMSVLSKQTHVPSRQLQVYFRQNKDTTFRMWLNNLRIEYGKKLIKENPTMSIEMVAEQCGFSSRNYFDLVFKDKLGMTPAAYHKQQK